MAKSKKRKPSFDGPDDPGAGDPATWVYRSDADAAAPTAADTPPVPTAATPEAVEHAGDAVQSDAATIETPPAAVPAPPTAEQLAALTSEDKPEPPATSSG